MCNNHDVMSKSESKERRMLQIMQASEVGVHDEEEVEVEREAEVFAQTHVDS